MIDLDMLGLGDLDNIDAGAVASSMTQEGTLIPAGWHVAIVRSAEVKTNDGKNSVEIGYEIVSGAAKGRKIRDWLQSPAGKDKKADENTINRMSRFLHQFGLVHEVADPRKKSGRGFAQTGRGWQDLTLTPTNVLIKIAHKARRKKNEITGEYEDAIDPVTNKPIINANVDFGGICNLNAIASLSKKDSEACEAVVRSWNAGGEGVASGTGGVGIPASASHKDLGF